MMRTRGLIPFLLLVAIIVPCSALIDISSVSPETGGINYQGLSGLAPGASSLVWNATINRTPQKYEIPLLGGAFCSNNCYDFWITSDDHTAVIDYQNGGTTYLTATITANYLGNNSAYNNGIMVGFDWYMTWAFTYVNPAIYGLTGDVFLVPVAIYDNITYFKYLDYGEAHPVAFVIRGLISHYFFASDDIGFSERGDDNLWMTGNGIRIFTYGGGTPPLTSGCNLTATIQNTANGHAVAGSTFHIYDLTEGTSEAYYLPFGTGSIGIPHTGDSYEWNATKPGYTGYPAYGAAIPAESCNFATLYAQLTGPPAAATNCTLAFQVVDISSYLAIPGAHVILSDGQNGITNLAGFTSFNTAKNTSYDYDVTATGYLGFDGNVTIGASDDALNIIVPLSSGVVPTATTYAPTAPHDTSQDALKFILNNMMTIVTLLFLMFVVGAFKMMTKK